MISACSFQEKTLLGSKAALLASYNRHVGDSGFEGRGIGFKEWRDDEGRLCMTHSFVNLDGPQEITGREGQLLVLLLMSWFVADQFIFRSKSLEAQPSLGFNGLSMTVVSDRLSEDNDTRAPMEANLRQLIDPAEQGAPIVLTRSPKSDSFSGDLIADNLAGWLTKAVDDPGGSFGDAIRRSAHTGVWDGWHVLDQSDSKLEGVPALSRFSGDRPA